MAEFPRPRDESAVARDLVVLDGLSRGDQGGVEHAFATDFSHDLLCFVDDAVDRRTFCTLRLLAHQLEGLLEAADLFLGFREMGFESGCQLTLGRLLDQRGQRGVDHLAWRRFALAGGDQQEQ